MWTGFVAAGERVEDMCQCLLSPLGGVLGAGSRIQRDRTGSGTYIPEGFLSAVETARVPVALFISRPIVMERTLYLLRMVWPCLDVAMQVCQRC